VTGHGRRRMHTSALRLQVDSEPVVSDGGIELPQEQVLLAAPLVRLTVLSIDVNRCSELGPGPLHVMEDGARVMSWCFQIRPRASRMLQK
jgi:hypothetical protein